MGEANPEAWAVLTRFLGRPPRYEHRENQVILHLGDQSLAAETNALWSDPSVFGDDNMLHVSWAGKHLTLTARRKDRSRPPGLARRRTGADKRGKLMRLPMRYAAGRWVLEFGGELAIAHGAEGELLIEARLVEDSPQKRLFMAESIFPILEQGTVLLAIVDIRDWSRITDDQRTVLIPQRHIPEYPLKSSAPHPSRGLFAVPITLGQPTPAQSGTFPNEGMGLWLRTQGVTAIGFVSSTIDLPRCVSAKPATSLNHALTLLSETYEGWRQSHTGSVYRQVLYQEDNGEWHPLSLLRDNQLASASQRVAQQLWQEIMRPVRQ